MGKTIRRAPRRQRRDARPPPLQPRQLVGQQDWVKEELSGVELGDQRLEQRLHMLLGDLFARPNQSIPYACHGEWKRTNAAYRFFDNPKVSLLAQLRGHHSASAERVAAEPLVLALNDTTALDYSQHPATEGLGTTGPSAEAATGLLLHSTLAVNADGVALGLLAVQCWARPAEEFGKKNERRYVPIEQKESVKWLKSYQAVAAVARRCPQTRLVQVGDRESDLYELFAMAQEQIAQHSGPDLLVRAAQDRRVDAEVERLWAQLQAQPLVGEVTVSVPARRGRPPRKAIMEVRLAAVTLLAPQSKPDASPVRLWAVLARERRAPNGVEPLEWLLLTTVAVNSFTEACERLRWYGLRWQIEVFHRVLKSGCAMESRQLRTRQQLERCLGVYLIVAWRILMLTRLGRETPQLPCTLVLDEYEWKALYCYTQQTAQLPAQPPSLGEAIRMLGQLGGHLRRSSDGAPAPKSLWLGLQRLADLTALWRVLTASDKVRRPHRTGESYG